MANYSPAQCLCSTTGFENPLWNERYYPRECPEEWRLAYFMNDFRAVYLRAVDWCRDEAQITAIADELDDGFQLVLEWPAPGGELDTAAILSKMLPLQQNIACVVLNIDLLASDCLPTAIHAIAACYPLNLSSRKLDEAGRRALSLQYSCGFVWCPQRLEALVPAPDYQVVVMPCSKLREIRSSLVELEAFLQQGVRVGLFILAAEQSAERALEVRTLIELMGLA